MFLGLDLSTQQLKAVVIDESLILQSETSVSFDSDLPHYRTHKGVITNESQVLSPVAMWVEALDLLFQRMMNQGIELSLIKSISGSGQQHGSIFWSDLAPSILASLDPLKPLVGQVCPGGLTYAMSPNWQDSSTALECAEIEGFVGGKEELARVTGSSAHHRFTGPQILRIRKTMPEIYNTTKHISLVSSFLCSLLLGRIAPIDISDICGGNFWDVKNERYDEKILKKIAGSEDTTDIKSKLGDVCLDGTTQLGPVSKYFSQKYKFSETCQVVPFTGDNPATILSLPLRDRDVIVSLGTSTTLLLSTPTFIPDPAYHVFAHPVTKGFFMAMLCYKNGSLAREGVRDAINAVHGGTEWEKFNELATKHKDTGKKIGFYWTLPEIIPNVEAGTWRFTVSEDGQPNLLSSPSKPNVPDHEWTSPDDDARVILESQFMDIRLRSHPFFSHTPSSSLSSLTSTSSLTRDYTDARVQARRIYTVGGASSNAAITGTLSRVLGGEEGVWKFKGSGNACALGGANKAAYAKYVNSLAPDPKLSFEEFVKGKWECVAAGGRSSEVKVEDGYCRDSAPEWKRYGALIPSFIAAQQMILDQQESKKTSA